MEKNLKKSYYYLDLPFNATVEDVQTREKALIKILKAEEKEKNISKQKEILTVKNSAITIIENIKNNGIPKEESHRFESSTESIIILLLVLLFAGSLCFYSFYIFL